MLRIRLFIKNNKKKDYFIVLIFSKNHREGKYIEKLGFYNPLKNVFYINVERVKFWINLGAKINNKFLRIFKKKWNGFTKKNTY